MISAKKYIQCRDKNPGTDDGLPIERSVSGPGSYHWIAILIFLAALSAPAQEALRNSVAGETAADSRSQQMQSQDYTFKDGDFRLLLTPAMGFEWNDNVNLSQTNLLDDYIVKPAVGIKASYPFTQRNVLFLDVSVGYDRYLKHANFSSFDLNSSSGTGLSFDIGIKDVTINLHDWMSYVQDSAVNGTVANTAIYGTFQNTAGLSGTWDLNQVTLSLGYDHQNIIATSSQYDYINHAAEMLSARASFQVHPKVTVGLESTAAFTTYEQTVLNNNDAYTIGAFTELRPGAYFKVTARAGFATYQFQNSSTTNNVIIINPGQGNIPIGTRVQTSDQNSWYANLNISHQPRDSISYLLDTGHEVQLGTQSDLVEDWYVRPSITWNIIKDLTFNTSLFYEHGNQGVGNITGNLTDTFDWYGGELNLEHPLTSWLSLGLNYRLTLRSSSTPNDGYTQNLVGLQLTYHPK
jgi:hypothetical protein